jgi:sphingosine kinase
MPLDICSVTHDNARRFSFMSVAMGLMCDIDLGEYSQKFLRQGFPLTRFSAIGIGTEHLRWLGDTRFVYGFLKGSEYSVSQT